MNKREFSKSLKEYRPELTITSGEITFFYKIYKSLIRLATSDPVRLEKIKTAYIKTNINTLKFRNLLAERLLIELTPRQADIYVSIITMVITGRNTL
tara:strand:- start:219 stop:509 length:291 start_codon:yes stop_codon:yes gene_type:complete